GNFRVSVRVVYRLVWLSVRQLCLRADCFPACLRIRLLLQSSFARREFWVSDRLYGAAVGGDRLRRLHADAAPDPEPFPDAVACQRTGRGGAAIFAGKPSSTWGGRGIHPVGVLFLEPRRRGGFDAIGGRLGNGVGDSGRSRRIFKKWRFNQRPAATGATAHADGGLAGRAGKSLVCMADSCYNR